MGGIGRHVDTRAECALLARLDAADGLSPLAAFGRGRAVVQAHGRLAWLKELLEVGLALCRRHDVTVSEQLLESFCHTLSGSTSLHELNLLEASLTTLGHAHALGHSGL